MISGESYGYKKNLHSGPHNNHPFAGCMILLSQHKNQTPIPANETSKGIYKPCHVDLDRDSENPPGCLPEAPLCLMYYGAGDACLQYIDCQHPDNPKFQNCVSCYKTCVKMTLGSYNTISICDKMCA